MSMIGNYYMTDTETVEKIRKGELSAEDFIYNENDEIDEEKSLDIDKAWHAIHFTLTGEIDEGDDDSILSKTVLGGNCVNDEDIGYGPAMEITSDEVREINAALSSIPQEDFRAKFNVKEMIENDIYPVTDDEDEDEFFEYVWIHFEALKEFYSKASENGCCLLFYIN